MPVHLALLGVSSRHIRYFWKITFCARHPYGLGSCAGGP